MHHLIIGNGPAAIAAIEAIRGRDPAADITLVSREELPFYSPCPLAEYVEDSVPRDHLFLRPGSFYDDMGVKLHLGWSALALDGNGRRLTVGNGCDTAVLTYDRLLIATGAPAFMPPVAGLADTPGVFALKTLADAESIIARLPRTRQAVVIGSGFIGLEAAQALQRRGVAVTVIEAQAQVLPQMLDSELAGLVECRLREHGITVLTGHPAAAVLSDGTTVRAVRAGDRELPCQLVICAAGVRPDLSWLAGSGIATATGILVDESMSCSLPGVYAAGDVVEYRHAGQGRRFVPNWPNAVNGGRIAGLNMAGDAHRYRGPDAINVVRIFDLPVASFGVRSGERLLNHRDGGSVRRVTVDGGRIAGGQFYGNVDGVGLLYELMNKGTDVERLGQRLADPSLGPGALLPAPPLPLKRAA